MKKGLTELVFILDRSASMSGLESDTMGGFNGIIDKQKEGKGEVIVSTVLFDTEFDTIHDRVPVEKVGKMTSEEYYTRGATSLLDAIGFTIKDIKDQQRKENEEVRPEKTIVTIITDGYENSSQVYNYADIKELVQKQTNLGWEFLFLGANIDAFAEGERLGIRRERSCKIREDRTGTQKAYKSVETFIEMAEYCEEEAMCDIGDEWCAESREYFEETEE